MSKVLPKKKLTAADIVIIAAIALLTVLSVILIAVSGKTEVHAIVKTDRETFAVPLGKDIVYTFTSNGYTYTAEVSDGEIFISSANCPDGICANTRAIGKRSGAIICVPGKMMIKCGSEGDNNGADVVVP